MNIQHNPFSAAPYGVFKIIWKYIKYWVGSVNQHGIHPPTLFQFVTEVMNKQHLFKKTDVEAQRTAFKSSKEVLHFFDYGKDGEQGQRSIAQIAKRSLKKPRYARLLASACQYYKVNNVLELGTSLGITTAYLARETQQSVVSLEGDAGVMEHAKKAWEALGIHNVQSIVGNFDDTLGSLGDQKFDLIYIDGNHRLEPTLRYFNFLLNHHTHDNTLLVFDDIHYSEQMEEAWTRIQNDLRVTSTVDLFFLGFAWINPKMTKQNFAIRF